MAPGVRTATIAVVAIAAVAAVAASVVGLVVADVYYPAPPGVDESFLSEEALRSARWADRDKRAGVVLVAASVVALGVLLRLSTRTRPVLRRRRLAVLAGAVAVVAAVVTPATAGAVAWTQVALRQLPGEGAITAFPITTGYWFAAFDDHLRYVVVGSSELSPVAYAVRAVLHVGAPIVALVALLVVLAALTGSRRTAPRSS